MKPILVIALLVVVSLIDSANSSNADQYEKHSLYKIAPKDASQLAFLKVLTDAYPVQLNVWNELERGLVQPVNIMVQPAFKEEFEKKLTAENIPFSITIENVAETIRAQMGEIASTKLKKTLHLKGSSSLPGNETSVKQVVPLEEFDYGVYHELDEINTWMDQIAEKYANYVQILNVSQSFEGRIIRGFKISIPSSQKKKAIWFDGGIHSREWVSPASVIYMTNELLSKYGTDASVTSMLDSYDFYSVPVINVDGYIYTFTTARLWRKTRSTNPGSACIGADPNRNWDTHFCEEGSSQNPCDETYCGQSAFSEIEVRLLADFLRKNKDDIICYMNIHSYSQLWMTPYGYTKDKPKDFKYINEGAKRATEALTKVYGTQYEYGPISQIIYLASGSSADWVYDSLGIVFSYGLELRDNGTHGFTLPPDQIIPTAIETFEGIKALVSYIKSDPMKGVASSLKLNTLGLVLMQTIVLLISVRFY